jgi:RND superfamily putative drug exporter
VLFVFNQSIWDDTAPIVQATGLLDKSSEFNHVTGPLNPNGLTLTSPQLLSLYATLGSPWNLPPIQPAQDSSVSPRDYQAFRATAAYISPNGKTIQYAVGLAVGDPSTTAAMNAVPKQRAEVQQIANEVHAKASAFLGESSVFYDISNISNKDLLRVIPLAVIVIGLLLAFLLRSLVAPIYLVASVVLSYLASLGMSVLIFMDLGGQTGIVFILPFLMFIFLLALGEDYNILVMTRIREEAHTMPLKQAVRAALEATGTTVTSAGLVLAGTFGVLGAISTGPGNQQVREIGFGLAIGILMDTFLVRTLLVPSVVVLLGKWNWWPSKHGNMVDQED